MSPSNPSKWEWFSLGAVLLGVLTLLHGGLVWGSQVLCGGDIVNQAHPLTVFWVSGPWLQGWCAYSFSGRPFFADIQSAILYPPRWFFRAGFPVEHVTTYLCLVHSLFGAVGMYLLSRIRFHHLPAMLAAIVWIGGGYTLLRYTNGVVTLIYALSWVPWVWWAVELCGPRRPTMTAVLALCAAMMFLAGSPQVVFITAVGMAIWALGRLLVEESTTAGRLRLLSHYIMAGLIAFVIVLPQFIASAEYTAFAVGRGGSAQWEHLVGDSLGPWLLITNLAPEFFAAGNAEGMYWGSQSGFMETNAYIGIAPLMLALFGAVVVVSDWRRLDRTSKRWFVCLLALFVAGLLVAFGRFTPIYRLLYDVVPGFNLFRVPARWLLWPFAVGILLAAWGADILLQRGPDRGDKRPFLAWAVVSAAMVVGTLLLLIFVEPIMRLFGFNPAATSAEMAQHLQRLSRRAFTGAFTYALAAAAIGLASLWTRRLPSQAAVVLLIIWTVLDLIRFWTPYSEPVPHEFFTRQELPSETIYHKIDASAFQEWFYPRTPLIELLDAQPRGRYFYTDWLYSYMVDEYSREIYTERGMVHGLENMRGYQPLQLESYASDFARIAAVPLDTPAAVGSFLHAPEVIDRTMLDAYNARLILTYEATMGDPARGGAPARFGVGAHRGHAASTGDSAKPPRPGVGVVVARRRMAGARLASRECPRHPSGTIIGSDQSAL
jgi:hypothetical protein